MNSNFYIETFGCQMNDRDSEIMQQLLSEKFQPSYDVENADVVIVNTCSIRQKAEQKAFSLLGRLKKLKIKNPAMKIGVVGCVAQQEGQAIIERMPFVDLVMGPQEIYRLPAFIEALQTKKQKKIVAVNQKNNFEIPPFLPEMKAGPAHKRFVTIMQGCNNFCTYCVVPYTRGREISRKFEDIFAEVRHLVENGVKEITLLGQNVNSYGKGMTEENQKNFSDLLRAVAALPGLERLRFTTSNPKDLTEDLMQCFSDLPNLCSHFHLPVQSGSNAVLKKMNRRYSIETYMEKVYGLRNARPDIAITTDIIVGFPTESDQDFELTMNLIEKVRYHGAFSFKYSDRPQAKSVEFDNKIEEHVKAERLSVLQKRINEIVLERNKEYVGKTELVMVEGPSKSSKKIWSGRTGSNHIVNFEDDRTFNPGEMVQVQISRACLHSLRGKGLSNLSANPPESTIKRR